MANDICPPSKIAKWFINRVDREAGDDITHLKLQKLIYFAQAWYLANKNQPLFAEDMEAWTHGPVVPSVWHIYKSHQWGSLPPESSDPAIDESTTRFLNVIHEKYGKFSAKELERMTHDHKPWKQTRGDLPLEAKCSTPIDKKMMRDFYAERIGKQWN